MYDKHLFSSTKLPDLPAGPGIPTFLFYATSLQTGASVRMTRDFLADWKVGRLRSPPITLAVAVAASSAFPPVLSPMTIKTNPAEWEDMPGTLFFNDPKYRSTLILSDGGVYDNLGLEAIAGRLDTVLVSDAGAPLAPSAEESNEWAHMTARVFDCVTDQARALRKRNLIADFNSGAAKGTYWGITTHIDDYHLLNAMTKDNAVTGALKAMRTRLNKFNEQELGQLINWGYALADAAMRRHMLNGGDPGTWPDPKYPL